MTGAMSVVAPGSPVQLLVATLVMMTFTLTTLKFGPYRNRIDDTMSFLVSLVSSGNTLAGLLLIMDKAYLALIPGAAILLMVLAFTLVGNGLRDALDVKSTK